QLLLAVRLVSTPLLLWLAWALSQPARRLETAAQRVAKGEFVIDPNLEKGTTEFRQAGTSFNQMVEAVNQMISGQQRLLSDISHELRSPLTRLRMANALATRKQGESPELTRIDTEA
ncbi:HAMP domain-containing protein, partial [Vibrio rotiferianus]